MLTGVCSSTIRNVIGSEFVRKKLSIDCASFLMREFAGEATFRGQHVYSGTYLSDEKCYWQ